MASFLLGLTGGMASGKSTVAGWLGEAGFTVVDADQVVAMLYAPGGAGAAAVATLFGDEMLTLEGAVDHEKVAARVFSDPDARRQLEARVHPLVGQRFQQLAMENDGVVVFEATLLVEAGMAAAFDLVVSIESPSEAQLQRAIGRGMAEDAAKARLVAQGDGEKRRQGVHRIIQNSGTLDDLRREVDALISEIREQD